MASDFPQLLLNLLSNNWLGSNTDGTTASFNKITDVKKYNYNNNADLISAHRAMFVQKPAGIGPNAKQVDIQVNLDVRCWGLDKESHFLNVVEEVLRILDDNLTSPITGIDELSPDYGTQQDLSDKRIGIWRKVIPVKLIRYNVSR